MNGFDSSAWLRLFAILATEICLVLGLVFILQQFARSVFWRRAVWQTGLVCLLFAAFSELSGAGRGMALFLFGQKTPGRNISVQITSPNNSATTAPSKNSLIETPLPLTEKGVSLPSEIWWPGIVWLAGFALVIARVLFAQLLLIIVRLRRKTITDEDSCQRAEIIARRLDLYRKIYLFETPGLASPMAFGIFWPSIGLPKNFSNAFSISQQDAMLAHELAHLAARDPLWYLLADLVSALLWWHPLVWWARRRLHATSELAADEATVILENGPGNLAECLLTLSQQMNGFRGSSWMGVEGGGFRSNLGQRIQRLLNLKEAHQPASGWKIFFMKGGFTILLASVVMFASGWIQNGEAVREKDLPLALQKSWDGSFASIVLTALVPEKTESSSQQESAPIVEIKAPPAKSSDASDSKIAAAKLLGDGKLLFEIGKTDQAETKLKHAVKLDPNNHTAAYYLDLIREQKFTYKAREKAPEKNKLLHPTNPPKVVAQAGAKLPQALDTPSVPFIQRTNVLRTIEPRKKITAKLNELTLDNVAFDKAPLGTALKSLADEIRQADPEKFGINFMVNPSALGDSPITISPPAMKIRIIDLLDAIVKASPVPLRYSIEDYGVVFSEKKSEPAALYTRIFKVDPGTVLRNLEKIDLEKFTPDVSLNFDPLAPNPKPIATNSSAGSLERLRVVFEKCGAELHSSGKAILLKDRLGMVYVRGTLHDIEAVENALSILNTAPASDHRN